MKCADSEQLGDTFNINYVAMLTVNHLTSSPKNLIYQDLHVQT